MSAQVIPFRESQSPRPIEFSKKLETLVAFIAEHAEAIDGSGRKMTPAEATDMRRVILQRCRELA